MKLINLQIIAGYVLTGNGTPKNPYRQVLTLWLTDGKFIFEDDSFVNKNDTPLAVYIKELIKLT